MLKQFRRVVTGENEQGRSSGGAFPKSYQLDITQGLHMHATDTAAMGALNRR